MFYRNVLFCAIIILPLFTTCSSNGKKAREISRVEMEKVHIKRYEQSLFNLDTAKMQQELMQLQEKFLPFLMADLNDPRNIDQLKEFVSDPEILEIYAHTMVTYADLGFLENELTKAFKHIKFYFPDWEQPVVYSYVSGLYYEVPVKYTGQELIIALDMYLGEGFEMYRKIGIPVYRVKRMTSNFILADCIDEIIRSVFVTETLPNHLLDKMVKEGRILYLSDLFLPKLNDEYKIGFTKEQLRWCRQNESRMWAYFIENELLYTSDPMIINRFVSDGPFTAAFQNESPARAALWVGWQIVRAYMANNQHVTPAALIQNSNSVEVLRTSGYKPRRSRL